MINSITYQKLKKELDDLLLEEEIARKTVEETASDGDFRENEPFQLAKQKFTQITTRIMKINQVLTEEVRDPIGHSLSVGRLLKITNKGLVDHKGRLVQPEQEEMILLLDDSGDAVVDGILSIESELGRLVKDGRGGRYIVNTGNFSRLYDVRLYTGDVEEYFRRYPVSKRVKIERLLAGEVY